MTLYFREPHTLNHGAAFSNPERDLWYIQRTDEEKARDGSKSRIAGYKDVSHDSRRGWSSFFGAGKRSAEADAYKQAHMTPSGVPGVLNLMVTDPMGKPIPFAPFNWNGRQMLTDAKGMIKYVERDYFQTAISLENERVKYVTQMVSLVIGQPSENVIALFGYEFYRALAGCKPDNRAHINYVMGVYEGYLHTAGLETSIIQAKMFVFQRYADAECSPEVMCNFGDNDPEWSRAFNKLSLLIEFHPSAILFDQGTLNPLDSTGQVYGDSGHSNAGPMDQQMQGHADTMAASGIETKFPDSLTVNQNNTQLQGTGRANKGPLTAYRART